MFRAGFLFSLLRPQLITVSQLPIYQWWKPHLIYCEPCRCRCEPHSIILLIMCMDGGKHVYLEFLMSSFRFQKTFFHPFPSASHNNCYCFSCFCTDYFYLTVVQLVYAFNTMCTLNVAVWGTITKNCCILHGLIGLIFHPTFAS